MCFTACGDGGDEGSGNPSTGNLIDLSKEGIINLDYLPGTWERYYFVYYVNNQFHHDGVYDEGKRQKYIFYPNKSATSYSNPDASPYVADYYYVNDKNRIYLVKNDKQSYVGDIFYLTEDRMVLKDEEGSEKSLYLYIKTN